MPHTLHSAPQHFDHYDTHSRSHYSYPTPFGDDSTRMDIDTGIDMTAYSPADLFRALMDGDGSVASTMRVDLDHRASMYGGKGFPHQTETSSMSLDALELPDGLMGDSIHHINGGQSQSEAGQDMVWDSSSSFMETLMSPNLPTTTFINSASNAPVPPASSPITMQPWMTSPPSPAVHYQLSPLTGPHPPPVIPQESYSTEPASHPILPSADSVLSHDVHHRHALPGRERFPLEIPRHTYQPMRNAALIRRSLSLTNLHQQQQYVAQHAAMTHGALPMVSPSLSASGDQYVWVNSPLLLPVATPTSQHMTGGYAATAASPSPTQLPVVGSSPSLVPCEPNTGSKVTSERHSFKSPRILPSRKPRRRSRTDGSDGWEESHSGPADSSSGGPPGGVDTSLDYITPPHQPHDPQASSTELPMVDMPPATMSASSPMSAVTSAPHSKPDSPPPTPPLAAKVTTTPTHTEPLARPPLPSSPAPDSKPSVKTPHKVSEKRRRELLKGCFDELIALLPFDNWSNEDYLDDDDERDTKSGKGRGKKQPNRIEILHRTVRYIDGMVQRRREMDDEVEMLRRELDALNSGRNDQRDGSPPTIGPLHSLSSKEGSASLIGLVIQKGITQDSFYILKVVDAPSKRTCLAPERMHPPKTNPLTAWLNRNGVGPTQTLTPEKPTRDVTPLENSPGVYITPYRPRKSEAFIELSSKSKRKSEGVRGGSEKKRREGDKKVDNVVPVGKKQKRKPLGGGSSKKDASRVPRPEEDDKGKKQRLLAFGAKGEGGLNGTVSAANGSPSVASGSCSSSQMLSAPQSSSAKTGYKQACLQFPMAASPISAPIPSTSSSSSLMNQPIELTFASSTLVKKPKKVMEDFAPEMIPFSKPLPSLKRVPTPGARWLLPGEILDLMAVVDFVRTFGDDVFGLEDTTSWELNRMVDVVCHSSGQSQMLMEMYSVLVKAIDHQAEVDIIRAQHRVAELMQGHCDPTLGQTLKSQEFVMMDPSTHVKILSALTQKVMETDAFREVIKSNNDRLQEMRKNKWTSAIKKKERKSDIAEVEQQITEIDAQIAAIDAELREKSASGDAPTTDEDGNDPNDGVRGGTFLRRLVDRDRSDRLRKMQAERRLEAATLARQRNLLVNRCHRTAKEVEELEEADLNWPSRYDAVKRMLRSDAMRVAGLDRDGRIYWWVTVTGQELKGHRSEQENASGEEDRMDQAIDPDSKRTTESVDDKDADVYGVLVEQYTYAYHDATPGTSSPVLSLDPKGKGKAPAYLVEATRYYTPPDNEAKRHVRATCTTEFSYIDSLSTLTKLYRSLNSHGLREKELRNGLKTFLGPSGEVFEVRGRKGPAAKRVENALQAFGDWIRGVDRVELDQGEGEYRRLMVDGVLELVKKFGKGCGLNVQEAVQEIRHRVHDGDEGVEVIVEVLTRWIETGNCILSDTTKHGLREIKTFSGVAVWCSDATAEHLQMTRDVRNQQREGREQKKIEKPQKTPSGFQRTRSGRRVNSTQSTQLSEKDFDSILRKAERQKTRESQSEGEETTDEVDNSDSDPVTARPRRSNRLGRNDAIPTAMTTRSGRILTGGESDRRSRVEWQFGDDESASEDERAKRARRRAQITKSDDDDEEEDEGDEEEEDEEEADDDDDVAKPLPSSLRTRSRNRKVMMDESESEDIDENDNDENSDGDQNQAFSEDEI
ncbi:hypothetical protein SpCBS45565_g05134 [Spizellomyces sp. 'palustris']|nr:hypothetical protein SpCBS45565_g05134 [Spizellomyces sp. 'palustris']